MIIAIDGPAAAGKGTLARRLAATLHLPYLDTGQLYRAVGRLVLDDAADPADPNAATAAAERLRPADLARSDLRDATASKAASQVASIPGVRAALLAFQRNFGDTHGAVLDGRDIGTIIFPHADIKLFVTASPQARAQRRLAEFLAKGESVSFEDVLADLTARDEADKNRAAAPLIPAQDAILLDTSHMDADAAFDAALGHIRQKHPIS
ncbi:MAG: cytidylate kinase [Acidocella sp. 20-63-7]|nr:MAG: cytidylate kinase [Acidocella sp. 20-63-7]HQT46309.1 (d)CMP kinase [Acidocella sp.]